MATLINALWAALLSLRLIMGRGGTARMGKEVFGSAQVGNILGDFFKVYILRTCYGGNLTNSSKGGNFAS